MFLKRLKIIIGIVLIIKNWPKVFFIKFKFLKIAKIYFRNGYEFNLNNKNYNQLIGLVEFFKDFPAGKIKNNKCYFNYKGKDVIIDYGDTFITSFKRYNYEKFFNSKNMRGKNIIDLGCSVGDSLIYLALHGARRVIGVEMLPYRADLAFKNIYLNKLEDTCKVVNAAVGGRGGELLVDANQENSKHYFSLKEFSDNAERERERRIPIVTLEDVIKNFNIEAGSFMKVDLQGGEHDFFVNAPNHALQFFSVILVKSYYNRDTKIEELNKKLQSAGFKCRYYKPPKWSVGYLFARMWSA